MFIELQKKNLSWEVSVVSVKLFFGFGSFGGFGKIFLSFGSFGGFGKFFFRTRLTLFTGTLLTLLSSVLSFITRF